MGPDASEREATPDEIDQMRQVVAESMQAGAAGFSSSHAPTQLDGDSRPIPSRFAGLDELRALVTEAGRHRGGSVSYLPASSIGGLDDDDKELLVELGVGSRLPIVIQGLGGRNKVDAPTAGWAEAEAFLGDAAARGAAIFSLLRNHPFDRAFSLESGTQLYDGVPVVGGVHVPLARREAGPPARSRRARRAARRGRPSQQGLVEGQHAAAAALARGLRRRGDQARAREVPQALDQGHRRRAREARRPTCCSTSRSTRTCSTVFRWENKTPEWEEAVRESQRHPSMIVGVSDGGAHLDRDDGSDWSSYFLRFWVFDRRLWTVEEGVRQMTQVPAALCGFTDRGLVLPGYAADLFLFDPETVGPGTKKQVADFPGGEARYSARPEGVHATIVNGRPIVVDGELTGELPGHIVSPGVR